MTPNEFMGHIESHPELEMIGVNEEFHEPMVKHSASKLVTRVNVAAFKDTEWKDLEEILTGKREPVTLDRLVRIVGYFARESRFNKSKVGENQDRRKGDYGVKEL